MLFGLQEFLVGVAKLAENLEPLTCAVVGSIFIMTKERVGLRLFFLFQKPVLVLVVLQYMFHFVVWSGRHPNHHSPRPQRVQRLLHDSSIHYQRTASGSSLDLEIVFSVVHSPDEATTRIDVHNF
jgi:hypothetical protein